MSDVLLNAECAPEFGSALPVGHGGGYSSRRNWLAKIQLDYRARADKTVLADMRFSGPLRVQRAFYPEAELCHSYLLHPPGGMVSGDHIDISLNLAADAKVLLTTPSAGKVYCADANDVAQRQDVTLSVAQGASLEWLPQETIVFDGSNAQFSTLIKLEGDAKLIAWEMLGLGRQAGDLPYEQGKLAQHIRIERDGHCILLESFSLDDELSLLTSKLGLMGFSQFGCLYLSTTDAEFACEELVELIREHLPEPDAHLIAAATHKPGLVAVRAFADDAERLRNLFITIWHRLREPVLARPACEPRIWRT